MSAQMASEWYDIPANVPRDRVVDFDMYNPPKIEEGLQEAWTTLQSATPYGVVWTPRNGGHWIAVTADCVKDVSADPQSFSNKINFLPKAAGSHGFIPATLDPPEHRPYRKLVSEAFSAPMIRPLEPSIREIARGLIENIAPQGECDFVKDYAGVLPIQVFMKLLDLPLEDADRLSEIADQMTRPDGSMTMTEATDAYYEYLRPVIEARRTNPGDDVLSTVANGKIDDRFITVDECLKVAGIILLAGLDTVVNLLSFIMQFLASNPVARQQLTTDQEGLAHGMEELLRRYGPVADARLITESREIDGVTVEEGDMIARPTMLYGLDSNIARCPMDVDLSRENVRHFTFGHGIHSCPGSHLARMELKVTIEEWLRAVPEFGIAHEADIRHQSGIVGAVESLPLHWEIGDSDGLRCEVMA